MKSQFSLDAHSVAHFSMAGAFRSRSVYLANKTKWLERVEFSLFAMLAHEHNKLK